MEINPIFHPSVPKYIRYPAMFIIGTVVLSANGIFLGTAVDMYNGQGEYTEHFTMAYNAVFVGMALNILLAQRFAERYTNKTHMLVGLVGMLIFNIICVLSRDPYLTIIACFFLGFVKVFALGEIYLEWLKIWSKKMLATRLYPFLYFMALGGSYFSTWVTSYFAYKYNWQYAYIIIFISILLSIILALFLFKNTKLKKRIPLYQMDIPGVMLIGTTMMLINYIVVYGKVEDWFSSNKIILASWVAVLTFLLFIKRELHVKRPAFNLNLLKKKNLPIGLLYFFLMGVFIPSTFQSSFTGGVLGYESITSADLNLYLIPGVIIGGIISYIWFYKNFSGHILMTFGFALLVAYHIFMYYGFSSDFTKEDFLIPLIFKGAGQAILFTSIGWYTTSNFPFPLVLKAVAMVILFRSFLSGAVFSGIYGYLLYAGKIKHLERLVYDTGNPTLVEGQTMQQLQKSLQIQSTLTASKELTGYIIIFGIVLISILLLVYTYKRVQSMLE